MKVSLLTGGKDPHYALGILSAIADKDVHVDFIGNDAMEKAEAVRKHNVKYYNLRGDQDSLAPLREKVVRVLKYYGNLMKYAAQSDSRLFHILWLNKFVYFDGTFLHLYYKLLGKKLVYTAHNINMWERDGGNNFISKIFLKVLYRSVNHIFVHTEKMKRELVEIYGVGEGRITVIPFGVNGVMPKSCLSRVEARKKLGLIEEKVILFFGNIAPYKGLENLIKGFIEVKSHYDDVKLIIAGSLKCPQQYWEGIQRLIRENGLEKYIIKTVASKRIFFIPS